VLTIPLPVEPQVEMLTESSVWSVSLNWVALFIWLNQTDQINQTNQINQTGLAYPR
jgi:hypothetical protein